MRAAPAAVADQGAGGPASGRPAGHFRDHPRVTEWLSVARCTARLWALQDVVQSVRALGAQRHLGAGLHGGGRGGPPVVLMLDATPVKAHRSAAGGKGGRTSRRLAGRGGAARRKSMPPSMNTAGRGGCSSAQAIAGTPRSAPTWWLI